MRKLLLKRNRLSKMLRLLLKKLPLPLLRPKCLRNKSLLRKRLMKRRESLSRRKKLKNLLNCLLPRNKKKRELLISKPLKLPKIKPKRSKKKERKLPNKLRCSQPRQPSKMLSMLPL